MQRAFPILVAISLALAGCTGLNRNSPDPSLAASPDDDAALIAKVEPTIISGLSKPEKDVMADAESRALNFAQPGESVRWVGDKSDTKGEIRAEAAFRVAGNTCRKFTHIVVTAGVTRRSSATACRQRDDSWQLVT